MVYGNLHVFLGRIFVSRATVRTLKT